MTLKIINLTQSDYDETLKLLNDVFTIQNKRDMNFEKEMPKIFKNGSKNAENHYGIKENGKLVSVLGIYPFDVEIMNERFKFSTVGNIATHPDFCGRGYMNSLLNFALEYRKVDFRYFLLFLLGQILFYHLPKLQFYRQAQRLL